jgi:hypothetical protein
LEGSVALLAALPFSAAQDFDHSQYTGWASCKIGSFVKRRFQTEAGGYRLSVPTLKNTTLPELEGTQTRAELVMTREIEGVSPRKAKTKTHAVKRKRKEEDEKGGDVGIDTGCRKPTSRWVEDATAGASSMTRIHPAVPEGTIPLDILLAVDRSRITRHFAASWEKK